MTKLCATVGMYDFVFIVSTSCVLRTSVHGRMSARACTGALLWFRPETLPGEPTIASENHRATHLDGYYPGLNTTLDFGVSKQPLCACVPLNDCLDHECPANICLLFPNHCHPRPTSALFQQLKKCHQRVEPLLGHAPPDSRHRKTGPDAYEPERRCIQTTARTKTSLPDLMPTPRRSPGLRFGHSSIWFYQPRFI